MPEIDIDALGVPNASVPEDGLLCAGQISPEQMDALHAAGFERFISLRVASEEGAGWEEARAAETGVSFQRLPVAGPAAVTSERARALRGALDDAEGPTVLSCGSSNRVGARLGIAAHEIDGLSAEE
ncbi:MAG: sulfur transferase domain-containing protein, partial [Planctomycetota bacterium]|nr:sulfur transferase domain-containing protein [Planctomycetota bacterium]